MRRSTPAQCLRHSSEPAVVKRWCSKGAWSTPGESKKVLTRPNRVYIASSLLVYQHRLIRHEECTTHNRSVWCKQFQKYMLLRQSCIRAVLREVKMSDNGHTCHPMPPHCCHSPAWPSTVPAKRSRPNESRETILALSDLRVTYDSKTSHSALLSLYTARATRPIVSSRPPVRIESVGQCSATERAEKARIISGQVPRQRRRSGY